MNPQDQLTHIVTVNSDRVCVALAGEIDLAVADELFAWLHEASSQNPGVEIEVDLRAVTFMDSTGIGVFIRAYQATAANGRRLRVFNAGGIVRQVLDVSGVLDLLSGASPATAEVSETDGDRDTGARVTVVDAEAVRKLPHNP